MIHTHSLEIHQHQKDLITHNHGKKLNHFLLKIIIHQLTDIQFVCRWRDDLYFTIASIVDFQRVMGSKVVFEFPANPLVVPQTCLRFKDLENVGVTGRHFSSFWHDRTTQYSKRKWILER